MVRRTYFKEDTEMSRHTIRLHKWTDGILSTIDHYIEGLEEALEFASTFGKEHAHTIKVYDRFGQIVHEKKLHHHSETYA